MAFTPQIPLTITGAAFDTETGLIVLDFQDAMPDDEPDPAGWTPTRKYRASVQPDEGLTEQS